MDASFRLRLKDGGFKGHYRCQLYLLNFIYIKTRKFPYLSYVALCGAPFRIFPFSEHTWIFISDCRFV